MNDMIRMGTFLFIITAIAGVLLAFTENLTSPLIGENRIKKLEEARQEVLPEAKSFANAEFKDPANGQTFQYAAGFKEDGQLAGIVLSSSPKGYAGPIEMVLGLDSQGKISGVKILSQKETPGLGTKLADPSFLEPFRKVINEKSAPVFLVKKDGGDIDAITAATISSRAFCNGIRDSMSTFARLKDGLKLLKPPTTLTAPVASEAGGIK